MTTSDSITKARSRHKNLNDGPGSQPGKVVQGFYYDNDVDGILCDNIETLLDTQLVDEDYRDVSDGVIIWWCAEDKEVDDLADLLVGTAKNLDNGGLIWAPVPRAETKNTVATQFVEETAKIVGLCVLSFPHVSV